MDLRKFIFAMFAVVSQPALSSFQAPDLSVLLPAANQETTIVNNLKDERIGLRTGSLSYSTVDVNLSGLGPDIIVRRTFADTSIGPVEFGSWILDVPRIVLSTNPNGWPAGGAGGVNSKAGICNDYSNPKFYPREGASQSANWHTEAPELFLGDGSSEKLITLDSKLKGNIFPADANYVTTSNAVVSCIEVNGRYDGYRVKTPNGMTYEMTKLSRIPGDFFFGGSAGKNIISVSRIIDQLGNEVVFNYREVRKPGAHGYSQYAKPNRFYVEEISADDGRSVVINYKENALEGEYPLIDSVEVKNPGNISGGAVWQYNYTGLTSAMKSNYCDFLAASPGEKDRCRAGSRRWYQGTYLREVVRPDDATWEFDYRGPIVGSVLDCCTIGGAVNHLSRVKFPTGGVATYQYGQLGYEFFDDSRFIYETPVVKKRTLHDPITGKTNVWNYSYSKNVRSNFTRTVVTLPDSSNDIHWFYRTGTYRGFKYQTNVKQAGTLVRTIERTPEAGANLGSYIGNSKFSTRYVGAQKRVIDDTYTRSIESRDELFRETSIIETGNATRNVEISYVPLSKLNPETWMLALIEEELISQAGSDESAKLNREFYPNGLLKRLEKFGVTKGEYEYTAKGELSKSSSMGSQEIIEEYSLFDGGKPGSIEFNDGEKKTIAYDGFGNIVSEIDEIGNETTSKFDALGRIRSLKRPSLVEVQFDYEPFTSGLPSKATIMYGDTIFSTEYYDGFGRPVASIVNANSYQSTQYNDNKIKQYRYDFNGNVLFSSHPTSGSISAGDFLQPITAPGIEYTYDALSRVEKTVDTSTGGSVEYCYDQLCQYGSETYEVSFGKLIVDERGYKTVNRYDCFRSPADCVITEIKRKVNNPSKIEYVIQTLDQAVVPDEWVTIKIDRNALGNPVSIENDGIVRSFDYYPGTSLVRTQKQPESLHLSYSYYPNGSIKTSVQGEKHRSYKYNKRGRLTDINTLEANLLEAEYYPTGKIKNAWSRDDKEIIRTHFSYTDFGSVKTQQYFPSNGAGPTVYDYNTFGHMDQMTYPHGDVVEYAPDLLGRATKLIVNGSELASITRRKSKDTLWLSNGIVVEKEKNDRGLDTNLVVRPLQVQVGLPDHDAGNQILDYSYRYDRANNLIQRQDKLTPSLTKNFAYDGLSRLIWDGADYRYDDNSNLTLNAGSVINYENNQVKSIESGVFKEFGHDEFGRLTSTHVNENLIRKISYNDTDRVESIASGGSTSLYSYDAFGALLTSHSLHSNSEMVDTARFYTDVFGRVLEKAYGADPLNPDRLVRYFYIENSLVAEKEAVENAPPSIVINSVSTSAEGGQEVLLNANATDVEDGDAELSSSIVWVSDIDGHIGIGSQTSSSLSVGVHQIHAEVTDSGGLTAKSSVVTISIEPEIELSAKVREISHSNSDSYEFMLATTPAMSGDYDFYFNGEKSVEATMNVNVLGVDFEADNSIHVCFRNSVLCSNSISASALDVVNDKPTITDISISGSAAQGGFLTFSATATDREEGNLTSAIRWYSSRISRPTSSSTPMKALPASYFGEGGLPVHATGGSYSASFGEVGTYLITAKVIDNRGLERTSKTQIIRNLEARIHHMGYAPYWIGHMGIPSLYFQFEVTNVGGFGQHLQFYAQGSQSPSWTKISTTENSNTIFSAGLFPIGFASRFKVCDKVGNFCSEPFTY